MSLKGIMPSSSYNKHPDCRAHVTILPCPSSPATEALLVSSVSIEQLQRFPNKLERPYLKLGVEFQANGKEQQHHMLECVPKPTRAVV